MLSGWIKNIRDMSIAILAVIVAIFAANSGINSLVEQKVNDDEFISKLSAKIRPTLVFNGAGSVLYDAGGSEYVMLPIVEDYEKKYKPDGPDLGYYKITVKGKRHLSSAPILECINATFRITPQRGTGNDWIYLVEDSGVLVMSGSNESGDDIFRLEIIP